MVAALEKPILRKHAVPIDIATYHGMIAHGLVDRRVELIRGVIIEKMPKSPLHAQLTDLIWEHLRSAIPDCWVRKEDPLTLADSEPEPDVSVVAGSRADYGAHHPATAHLVVEVAVTSVEIDREKGITYAEAGVGEYWLVLAGERAIEVHRAPAGGRWTSIERIEIGAEISPAAFPHVRLALDEIFPR